MKNNTTTAPRVYIASLSDYNAGSLLGEWFDLDDYSSADEMLEAIADMLKKYDEEHGTAENCGQPREEWAAHDFEGFPRSLYSESMDFEAYYNYAEAMNELSEDEQEAFQDYCDNLGRDLSEAAELVEEFREDYQGQHDSEEAFADHIAEELGYFDAMKKAGINAFYFDTKAFARDIFIGDYWISENNHVFRNR
ncbi:antirestriction protein ArdA [Hymenobacter latericus]|uniref:antirestriction protein ArdA n=1 Tax=Hymenobacter sp. YIM 151858-1 TaxID=2987688 RepID=UPI00222634D3|nr:antirestriction protein ArdA [Hymenobacter sp. YIM 151858-1]UYZ60068.1 antirestriction protein ArdA [Hymenobacter sp. YIM 151858-1]